MAKPKQKCIVLIDGSNFYFKLKDLGLKNLLEFDFKSFINYLKSDYQTINSIYYIGKISTDGTSKTQKLFNNQRKLLAHLRANKINYTLGYLMKNGGKYHEKGVDVNIAVDILVTAYEKLAQKVILISSDTDLLPAVRKAREKLLKIEYVGFSHKPSLAMIANSNNSRLLKKEDILPFLKQKNPAKT